MVRFRAARLGASCALLMASVTATATPPGLEVRVGGYALRMPAGYVSVAWRPPAAGPPTVGAVYMASARAPGAAPLIAVTVTTMPPGRVHAATEGLRHFEQLREQKGQSPIPGPIVLSQVHGLWFARQRFTEHLIGKAKSHTASGFDAVCVNGRDLIVIAALDSDPSSRQTLPAMEAAVLTFHKAAAP